MKKLTNLLAVLVLMFTINSCKKNEISTTDVIVPYEPGATVTTTVAGKVTNETGTALNGVTITIGSTTVMTDAEGQFIIPKATLSQNAGLIKATKAGYFAGSRTIRPKEKVVNNVVIQLVKKTLSGSFTNASGGTITVATGGSIEFPANAIVTKSGGAYTGTVKVSAYFLNPTSANCYKEMPGDLRGINATNNEQVLTSYGMMAVELEGSNGEALQIASGKTAQLTFPVDAAIQSKAPATIPLWYFDEVKGMWAEQGTATKTGNNYVGSVSHFTWWNCDWGGGPLTLTAKFVDQNGNALNNYHVYYITSNGWGGGGGHGYTASDGSLTGNIPANENIIVRVEDWNFCGGGFATLYNATVGPYTQNTDLGTITVNIANLTTTTVTLKGTVNDCSNAAVANGYAVIKLGNGKTYYTQINNGSFSKTITYCSAVPATTASVTVFDLNTLKQNATPITLNVTGAGTFNVGTVQACGVQNIVRYIAAFLDQNGSTINGTLRVSFSGDSTQNYYIYAPVGGINIYLPANKIITRKIYYFDKCQNETLIDSVQIGPFTTDFNAGTINVTIPQANTFNISGTVQNCSNANVANGFATIKVDGLTYTTAIANGLFSQQISRCSNIATTATISVTDNVAYQQNSTPITVSVTNVNVNIGTVQACGVSVAEFLNYTIDSTSNSANDSLVAYKTANGTYFSGSNFSMPYAYITANTTGFSTGSFDLNLSYTNSNQQTYSSYNTGSGLSVTTQITEYGSVGQYIAGTFSGLIKITGSPVASKQISGSFRIKRVQ